MEERDVTEEDEGNEDGIRFVTLESRFESKETVLNWLTINLPCLLCKKMVKGAVRFGKIFNIKPLVSRCCVANLTRMLQKSSFNQTHVLVASSHYFIKCIASSRCVEDTPGNTLVHTLVDDKYSPARWSVTNVRACEPEPRAASREPIFASHCFFSSYLFIYSFIF